MKEYSFLEFIKSGKVGNITIGSKREDVHKAFGDPEGWIPWGSKFVHKNEAQDWSYGILSFIFDEDKVDTIGVYYTLQHLTLPKNFILKDAFPKAPLYTDFLNKTKTILTDKDIIIKSAKSKTDAEIVFPSGVIALLTDSEKPVEQRRIISIRLSTFDLGEQNKVVDRNKEEQR